jgi:hypothetical protein
LTAGRPVHIFVEFSKSAIGCWKISVTMAGNLQRDVSLDAVTPSP